MEAPKYQNKPLKEQIRIAGMHYMVSEFFWKIDSAIKELDNGNVTPLRQIKKELIILIENKQEALQNENIKLVEGFPSFLPIFVSQLKEILTNDFFQDLNEKGRFLDLKGSISCVIAISENESEQSDVADSNFIFENKLIDNVEPKDIYDFFNERLVKGRLKCLDKSKLQKWLKNSFELEENSNPLIVFSNNPSKGDVRGVFHKFFNAYGKHGEKPKFVKLLSDHFAGYDYETTFNNFKSS